jgi:hypothetical protein
MTRVVVTSFPDSPERELDVERAILGPDVEVVQHLYNGNLERIVSACKDARHYRFRKNRTGDRAACAEAIT